MSNIQDEIRTLRARVAVLRDAIARLDGSYDPPIDAVLGQVFANPLVPLSTGAFFSFRPATIVPTAGEVEGGAATITIDTTKVIVAYVIGPKAPVTGENLTIRRTNHVNIASRQRTHTAASRSVPGCPCVGMPATLHMLASKPTANGGAFQNTPLVWGTAPSVASGVTPPQSIAGECYSAGPFSGTWGTWTYVLGCVGGSYALFLLDISGRWLSPTGTQTTPFAWYKWVIGFPGNTCIPFVLAHGSVYVGGDASDVVTITL